MAGSDDRRAAAADDRQRSTKVTPAASASAKENTVDQSPIHTQGDTSTTRGVEIDQDALEAVDPTDETSTSGYSRVTADQASAIVRLRRANPNISMEQIAAAIGVKSHSTVSYWLRKLDNDTVPEARKLAKTNALRSVMKLEEHIDHSDPRVSQGAAKALVALAGVAETSQQVQVGVQVVVGQVGQPAGDDPFVMVNLPPAIEP